MVGITLPESQRRLLNQFSAVYSLCRVRDGSPVSVSEAHLVLSTLLTPLHDDDAKRLAEYAQEVGIPTLTISSLIASHRTLRARAQETATEVWSRMRQSQEAELAAKKAAGQKTVTLAELKEMTVADLLDMFT